MAVPTTVPDLLDRLRRSELVPTERLEGFLIGLQTSEQEPATPAELLELLIEAGMITRFHADRLAAGKYKGFKLGSYLILDQIGIGGMGQVYLAEHTNMRRLVALKVLPVFSTHDVVARQRFFREARAAATLDHPNIVRVFDLCQDGKLLYLVMEYVEGVSLQSLVARQGQTPITEACHYVRQVAFGLQHAHDLGFVHRDIKPANLLLERTGIVKILDLGLVRSEEDAAANLTRRLDNKSILGTADYVAPEQARDSSNVDIRADIYSLGATLYFLLAGRPLFPEGKTAQKLVWQQVKDPVPLKRIRPDVPPELAGIVHTMIQKRPEDRFQTPAEVFDALAPWTQEEILPPAEELMPPTSARYTVSRSGTISAAASRAGGSSAKIVQAAMRSGVTSQASLHRAKPDSGSDLSSTSSSRVIPIPILRTIPDPADGPPSTGVVAAGDTQRPLPSRSRPRPAPPEFDDDEELPVRQWSRGQWGLIGLIAVLFVTCVILFALVLNKN